MYNLKRFQFELIDSEEKIETDEEFFKKLENYADGYNYSTRTTKKRANLHRLALFFSQS